MGVCFICGTKLNGERTRVCSSITPHSNVPFPEKIVDLMGEDFVAIVTPADHMCKRCTSLLTHMDKLESDLMLVKTTFLSFIQKHYGLLPPNHPVKNLDVINGQLKEQSEAVVQKKEPAVKEYVSSPLTMSNPRPKPPTKKLSPLKIYKCGFCAFQSKELGYVRFHLRTHGIRKIEGEKSSQSSPKMLAISEEEAENISSAVSSSTNFKQEMSEFQDDQHKESTMDVGTDQQDKNQEQSENNKREALLLEKSVPYQAPEASELKQLNAISEQEIDVGVSDDSENEGGEKVEIKTGNLDIESMLAAIHNE